ncbi:MAG: DUF6265 family protein [Gemmatimonadales bacterium]|nr:DUF6265 family protein [Gemmatimonadales bacterium]
MLPRLRSSKSFALLAALGATLMGRLLPAQSSALNGLGGTWIYVEDRTEGRAAERLGPPMSSTFAMRVEPDAVVLVRGHGSGHANVRLPLDGTVTEVADRDQVVRYRGTWNDGAFSYQVEFLRGASISPDRTIRREFRSTADGLVVRAVSGASGPYESVAVYRHAEDIPMPAPAKAAIGGLGWLAGAWTGTRSSGSSLEERWSPPLGGAMLGVSRTVSRGGRMSAFEYLRILERDSGLVYVAQPNGAPPTEFVLTELTSTRAVFANPRHDYPKRIVYELSADGDLSATIGYMTGGTPRRFDYTREGSAPRGTPPEPKP